MKANWNLDVLYKGYDDPKFKEDTNLFIQHCEAFNTYATTLEKYDVLTNLKNIISLYENMQVVGRDLRVFCSLKQSTNTADKDAINQLRLLDQNESNIKKARTIVEKYISNIENLDSYIQQDETLSAYTYFLTSIQEGAKYTLDESVEETIAKMNLFAGKAWKDQFSYLTSSLEIDMDGESVTLSEIRNLAYDPDQEVRKKAYQAELKGYAKIKDAIAFSLNNIKAQVNMTSSMRRFPSALDEALHKADMKRETLDAMIEAMKEYMPKFREYLKRKATLLGHTNGLPFYDLFAPVGEDDTKYSIEEARVYLHKQFSTFSTELADMLNRAYDEEWIDFYPKKGKVGGAFCYNMPKQEQSRILLNYDGFLTDIVTLAHELGHAFHGQQIATHKPLNLSYSMPVAETASTFNENIIMNAAIQEASGDAKIALMESQLQDTTQIILDIYSRFVFESTVFERKKEEFLFPEQLEQIMLDAQKEAYGDGLDPNQLHPYMWVCKGHYYSEALSFYNFPYAFGGLFARGLYALYMEDRNTFVSKYNDLLHATTITSVEDCAKTMGIDLSDKAFWLKSLASYSEVIDAFLEATK